MAKVSPARYDRHVGAPTSRSSERSNEDSRVMSSGGLGSQNGAVPQAIAHRYGGYELKFDPRTLSTTALTCLDSQWSGGSNSTLPLLSSWWPQDSEKEINVPSPVLNEGHMGFLSRRRAFPRSCDLGPLVSIAEMRGYGPADSGERYHGDGSQFNASLS